MRLKMINDKPVWTWGKSGYAICQASIVEFY